jgi:lactoylglutathione lyase
MFTSMFPILTTPDLERSLHFYRDLLGATETYRFPDSGPPVYVALQIGDNPIGIGQAAPPSSKDGMTDAAAAEPDRARPFSLWVYADDCDEAVRLLADAGVRVLAQPEDQPWGERVARVSDPDGTEVHIGSAAGGPSANT